MVDSEKVFKGLEICSKIGRPNCVGCPYEKGCMAILTKDAMELLKEQDKIIKSLTRDRDRLLLERIAELQHNIDMLHTAMQDTILVNNAIKQRKGGKVV